MEAFRVRMQVFGEPGAMSDLPAALSFRYSLKMNVLVSFVSAS